MLYSSVGEQGRILLLKKKVSKKIVSFAFFVCEDILKCFDEYFILTEGIISQNVIHLEFGSSTLPYGSKIMETEVYLKQNFIAEKIHVFSFHNSSPCFSSSCCCCCSFSFFNSIFSFNTNFTNNCIISKFYHCCYSYILSKFTTKHIYAIFRCLVTDFCFVFFDLMREFIMKSRSCFSLY